MALSIELAKTSFAAGEVSPELRVRTDLAKNQTGCWFLENMVVLLEGGVTRRPGTQMVMPYKDPTRVAVGIPFRFSGSGSNAYLIVINAGVARWILGNAVVEIGGGNPNPYEVAVPYTDADLGGVGATVAGVSNLRYAQSGNVVFLFCDGHAPQTLTRNADNSWTLAPYLTPPFAVTGNGSIAPVDTENLNPAILIQVVDPGGGVLTQITSAPGQTVKLNAVGGNLFDPANIGGVWRVDEATLSNVPEWTANENIGVTGVFRRFNGNVYINTAIGSAGPNAPVHTSGSVEMIANGVIFQYVARDRGFVQITAVTDATHATALVLETIPVSVWVTETPNWWPSAWDGVKGWPNRVALFGNSLVSMRQGKFWKTQPGTFNNYDIPDPTSAASAISIQLLSPYGSLVFGEWFYQNAFLGVGTRDDEWVLAGQDPFSAITVSNLNPYPSQHEGSAQHIPAYAEGGVVFIGRTRKRAHFGKLEFGGVMPQIREEELTLSARHILAGQALGVTHQRDPNRLNWYWCADGSLVGETLMIDQQINGWARHPQHVATDSAIEWIVTIPSLDDGTSWTYFGTRRTINGQTARFVELLQPFFVPANPTASDATGAWFLDCALQYSGPPVQRITGLNHLVNQTVGVHADGCMYLNPDGTLPIVDAAGGINLTRPTQNAVIGLPISYRVRLLPLDIQTPKGTTAGARQKANHLSLRLVNSAGGNVCVNPDQGGVPEPLTEAALLTYGVPIPLFTGLFRTPGLDVPLADEMIVEITGNDTMPFTLSGVDPDVEITETD